MLAATPAIAADVSLEVQLGMSYTDNLFLEEAPDDFEDTVFRGQTTLGVNHESPHWDAGLRYTFDWYRYEDFEADNEYQIYDGFVTGKAFNESLTVRAGVRRSQVLGDPDDVASPDRLALSGNLIDRDQFYVNPQFERDFGRSVSLSTSYRYTDHNYDDPLVQENTDHNASFRLDNYRAGAGPTWALRYEWRRSEYDISPPWEYQDAGIELGSWVSPNMRLFAAGGKESPWDDPFTPSLEDTYWEAGFAYTAADSLDVEFAAGEREFGSNWRGRINYRFRRGSTSFSYVETPWTTGYDRGGSRPVLDPDEIDDFLSRPGSAERYVSERLRWQLRIELRRTTFSLVAFDERRVNRIDGEGSPFDDQEQTGVNAAVSWEAGNRTSINARIGFTDRRTSDTQETELIRAGLGVRYRLGAKSTLSLTYDYAEEQPTGEIFTRDYVANTVSLFFVYSVL